MTNKEHAERIILTINKYFSIDCIKKSRKRTIVNPRQIAMYYMYKNINISYSEIGKLFNQDHATVIHSVKSVKNLLSYDKQTKVDISKLDILVRRCGLYSDEEKTIFDLKLDITEFLDTLKIEELIKIKNKIVTS